MLKQGSRYDRNLLGGVCAGVLILLSIWRCMGQTPAPARPVIEKRADAMLTKLTLTKLTLTKKNESIGGYRDMYIRPLASLGFTQLNMSNGPKGLQA